MSLNVIGNSGFLNICVDDIILTNIKLPFCVVEDGTRMPDWEYMEKFIKSLPFSESI